MNQLSCPLCESKYFNVLYQSTLKKTDYNPKIIAQNLKNTLDDYNKHGRIVKCSKCELVYINPLESMEKLLKGYSDVVDEEYVETEKYRKSLSERHLKLITKYKKTGKILDIGCFAGYFLQIAQKNGWKGYGIEPSKWAIKLAKKRGVSVIGKTIENTKLPSDKFDVVTLWDVIEHLPNPRKVIKISHRVLKKNGIIAIATPDIESWLSKILGSRNPHIIRMHLVLFSPKTLSIMLKKEGFKIIYQGTYGRTFPISYIIKRLKFKTVFLQNLKDKMASFPLLSKIAVTLNLGDSFILIARKI